MANLGDPTKVGGQQRPQQLLDPLNLINRELAVRKQRLATGKQINSAEENSAGFVIGRTLQARNKGLAVALSNIGDARSSLSVAEGGASSILDILETMKEKAIRAANGLLGDDERQALNNEISALAQEIDDINGSTVFGDKQLLAGTTLNIQTGAETTDNEAVEVSNAAHDAATLGVSGLDISGTESASGAMSSIDAAMSKVKGTIASLGTSQMRLGHKEENIATTITNTEAARSRIMDADFAREQLAATQLEMQQQSGTAAMAQANATSQSVMALV